MNLPTAALVILFGTFTAFWPAPKAELTFEQRWEPAERLQSMIDKSPRELTFEERWEPVRRLPQMLPGKADRDDTPPQGIVRAFRVTRQVEGVIPGSAPILPTHAFIQDETPSRLKPHQDVSIRVNDPSPPPPERPKVRTIRKAELDICQRHGMRKVHYGKTWRCRK